jgi:hypothetical protein
MGRMIGRAMFSVSQLRSIYSSLRATADISNSTAFLFPLTPSVWVCNMELLLCGCVLFLDSGDYNNHERMFNFRAFLFVVFYDVSFLLVMYYEVATPAEKFSVFLSS